MTEAGARPGRGDRPVGQLNMVAVLETDDAFARGVAALIDYCRAHGHGAVPAGWCDSTGFPLGAWVAHQRLRRLEDRMTSERCEMLENVDGWSWDRR